jgi:acyl-CoA thioester hydrolase
MWKTTVRPAFNDLDAFVHVNNCRLPVWFELAREPVFEIFTPGLDEHLVELPLIVAKITIDYIAQMTIGHDVELRTYVKKIGRSSVTVYQEAYQRGVLSAKGDCVMVYFDYDAEKAVPVPSDIADILRKHMIDPDNPNLRTRSGRFTA